jgi:hypothetical protein
LCLRNIELGGPALRERAAEPVVRLLIRRGSTAAAVAPRCLRIGSTSID